LKPGLVPRTLPQSTTVFCHVNTLHYPPILAVCTFPPIGRAVSALGVIVYHFCNLRIPIIGTFEKMNQLFFFSPRHINALFEMKFHKQSELNFKLSEISNTTTI